jgi:hypothetical protein
MSMKLRRRPLTIREILSWADAYRERTGKWPTKSNGSIVGTIGETWSGVDTALRAGLRTLPGNSSLAQLLREHRNKRNVQDLPALTEEQILVWADDHFQHMGQWPTADSGSVMNAPGEKWSAINQALQAGARGLPGGSSLARLLAQRRGVRNRKGLPPLAEEQILAWADDYYQQHGAWPTPRSGAIPEAPGETWMAANMALRKGLRGLPGGSSLALLLAEKRDVRNVWSLPDLSIQQILAWADGHHQRTANWPNLGSGAIMEAPEESWSAVDHALRRGSRGLPGGFSLAELLGVERGVRTQVAVPRLRRKQILAWAVAHHRRTNKWPTIDSGVIPEAPEETWCAVETALRDGLRGLKGGSSLARFLDAQGKKRNHVALPPLSQRKILGWADEHFRRTGSWPKVKSGPVVGHPGERWNLIDNALRQGMRGLPGGSSLRRLLARKRGVRNPAALPPLTEEQIVGWAELHYQRTGAWPQYDSGPVVDAPGETWTGVDIGLRRGKRGLIGGCSLAKLLAMKASNE